MFSIRSWLVLLALLWAITATGQDVSDFTNPGRAPTKETAMSNRTKAMRFEHRTFATEPEARAYADKLTQALGTQDRFYRPWTLSRGRDKGLWTVAQYDFR